DGIKAFSLAALGRYARRAWWIVAGSAQKRRHIRRVAISCVLTLAPGLSAMLASARIWLAFMGSAPLVRRLVRHQPSASERRLGLRNRSLAVRPCNQSAGLLG